MTDKPKPIRQTRSKILRAFLQDWLDWVDQGAPNLKPYFRGTGLCHAALIHGKALDLLREALKRDCGNSIYPFGMGNYKNQNQHLCPKRLAWVRAKLGVK